MNRRTFLKIAGMGSLSFATGCTSQPEKNLFSLVQAPGDMVTGEATWYASTCRECPAGCGILAKNREGRVIKVEGNPLHPVNEGTLCMRGQSALQGLYNPDRIKTPLLKEKDGWQPLSFERAEALLAERAGQAAQSGPNRVRMLTEVVGESLLGLFSEALDQWQSQGPLIFEPYAYEALKAANHAIFGVKGLVSYRVQASDLLVSFGADFLETWLSPVEYARKFKSMHGYQGGRKGLFWHVSPYQSLTAANADRWLSCRPGGESAVALGLIREMLGHGRGTQLPQALRSTIAAVAAGYDRERVAELSGLDAQRYDQFLTHLIQASRPLILGTGTGGTEDALQANLAVNLLNLVLDPELSLFDFNHRHRVEIAAGRSEIRAFFKALQEDPVDLLLLNNVNPVFALPSAADLKDALSSDSLFVVSFSNFMDETTQLADLVLPVQLPLETWDEYGGRQGIVSTLQPAMASLIHAPGLGDLLLRTAFGDAKPVQNFKVYLYAALAAQKKITGEMAWAQTLRQGGLFTPDSKTAQAPALSLKNISPDAIIQTFEDAGNAVLDKPDPSEPGGSDLFFIAAPSIRFFDGRGANRPWLDEIPDPLMQVAWQTPVGIHPQTLAQQNLKQGDLVRITSRWGSLEAPAYETVSVRPNTLVIGIGQGHTAYGRYAEGNGINPWQLLSADPEGGAGGPLFAINPVTLEPTGRRLQLAHTDGSRVQHGRKIALSVALKSLEEDPDHPHKAGLTMADFPFTLPLPEGYDPKRDFYPPHEHIEYRWAMAVDLDRCIGCGACASACYAENNLGVVGQERIIEGREMAWLRIERYLNPQDEAEITFLPMLCQHCDNAPCESVCPVYAPHHSKEGLNNQIYNRCIGTRFCSQNCPYKVRRFNWFEWQWPEPVQMQLNPDVTVRGKGVMEKCSFCVQRIKAAHNVAKNEQRMVRDGEVTPACVQTCPTGVFTFGNLMDRGSRVRQMVADQRAYQVMGYLNTKPAVIYLKKVRHES